MWQDVNPEGQLEWHPHKLWINSRFTQGFKTSKSIHLQEINLMFKHLIGTRKLFVIFYAECSSYLNWQSIFLSNIFQIKAKMDVVNGQLLDSIHVKSIFW